MVTARKKVRLSDLLGLYGQVSFRSNKTHSSFQVVSIAAGHMVIVCDHDLEAKEAIDIHFEQLVPGFSQSAVVLWCAHNIQGGYRIGIKLSTNILLTTLQERVNERRQAF